MLVLPALQAKADAGRSSQVPSGLATVVGKSVFLSMTVTGLDLPASVPVLVLPGNLMTLLVGGA